MAKPAKGAAPGSGSKRRFQCPEHAKAWKSTGTYSGGPCFRGRDLLRSRLRGRRQPCKKGRLLQGQTQETEPRRPDRLDYVGILFVNEPQNRRNTGGWWPIQKGRCLQTIVRRPTRPISKGTRTWRCSAINCSS